MNARSVILHFLLLVGWNIPVFARDIDSSSVSAKGNFYLGMEAGGGVMNRVCGEFYERPVIGGSFASFTVGYCPVDKYRIRLESGGFYEALQIFNDESSEDSKYYNNKRLFFNVAMDYFPGAKPFYVSMGAGIGNLKYTTGSPLPTQQGYSSYSTVFDHGTDLAGSIGYERLMGKSFALGARLQAHYTWLNNLTFITGEELLEPYTDSFWIALSLSIGVTGGIKLNP